VRRPVHHHQGCGCGCGGEPEPDPTRDWSAVGDDELVCYCSQVAKKAVVDAIALGAVTMPLLGAMTGAGRVKECAKNNPSGRSCAGDLAELVRLYAGRVVPPPTKS